MATRVLCETHERPFSLTMKFFDALALLSSDRMPDPVGRHPHLVQGTVDTGRNRAWKKVRRREGSVCCAWLCPFRFPMPPKVSQGLEDV